MENSTKLSAAAARLVRDMMREHKAIMRAWTKTKSKSMDKRTRESLHKLEAGLRLVYRAVDKVTELDEEAYMWIVLSD